MALFLLLNHGRFFISDNNNDCSVMCFLCECKPKPGSLSLEKCLKLGVPKGPLLGKLKNGEIVTIEGGVTIRPEDVREPDEQGPKFLGIHHNEKTKRNLVVIQW